MGGAEAAVEERTAWAPTVSIVIPVFERPSMLRRALGSVLEQTFQDFEVIVVDDASEADLKAVVAEFDEPRFRFFRMAENGGPGAARNHAIGKSRGEFIAFLDSDDRWLPEKLGAHLRYIRQGEEAGGDFSVTTTGYVMERIGAQGRVEQEARTPTNVPDISRVVWGCSLSPGSTMIVRRSVFEDVGAFDETFRRLEDWEWLFRCVLRHPVHVVPAPLTVVQVTGRAPYRAVQKACERLLDLHGQWLKARSWRQYRQLRSTVHLELAAGAVAGGERYLGAVEGVKCLFWWPLRKLDFYARAAHFVFVSRQQNYHMPADATVLHVIADLNVGGAERMLTNLILHERERGRGRHIVVSLKGGGYFEEVLRQAGVKVYNCRARTVWGAPLMLWRLFRIGRWVDADAFVGWMYHGNLAAALLRTFVRRRRLIWGIRCSQMDLSAYGLQLRLAIWLSRVFSFVPDATVVNSTEGLRVHQELGFRGRNMLVIENGFDVDSFKPDSAQRAAARRALDLPDDAFVVCILARVDPMKDYPLLLEAAQSLPDYTFLAVGAGTPKLRALPNLQRLGVRNDVAAVLNASDMLVSCSAFGEGLSNSIGEAMATGLPVVTTSVGDSAHLVGDAGIVVPPRDADALRKAIRRVAENETLRKELGERARARIEQRFSLQSCANRFHGIIHEDSISGKQAHDGALAPPSSVAGLRTD